MSAASQVSCQSAGLKLSYKPSEIISLVRSLCSQREGAPANQGLSVFPFSAWEGTIFYLPSPEGPLGDTCGWFPHLFDGKVVDEVVVVFVKVAVQGDAVALVEQVLERVDPLDTERALQAVLEVGVVEDDVEAERLGTHRYRLAWATCGEDENMPFRF